MLILFEFKCPKCDCVTESLVDSKNIVPPKCPKNVKHGPTEKIISTPAFTFRDGKGTDHGMTMRIADKRATASGGEVVRPTRAKVAA